MVGTALLAFTSSGLGWHPALRAPELTAHPDGWSEHLRTVEQVRAGGVHALLTVMRAVALVLVGAVGANLLFRTLDRATAHRARVQLLAALGATPGRVLRGELRGAGRTAAAAAGVGALLGAALLRLLARSWPPGAGRWTVAGPDAASVLLAAALPAALATLCILLPARAAAARELARTLLVGEHATPGPFQMLMRRLAARAQFAASLALAVGAGLLLRSTGGTASEWGWIAVDPAGIRSVTVDLGAARTETERAAALERALRALRETPGVHAASFSTPAAASGEGPVEVVTSFCRPPCVAMNILFPVLYGRARVAAVSPGHFELLGIPLVAGRLPGPADGRDGEPVAVLSRGAASALFPKRDPLGQRLAPHPLALGPPLKQRLHRVVGVVEDVRLPGGPVQPGPMVYLSALQHPPRSGEVALRADPGVDAAAALAAAGVRPAGEELLADRFRRLTAPARWSAAVLAALALVAVVLCAHGLHGLVAAAMAARTREIGVRMALGAGPAAIRRLALGEAWRIARGGIPVGALASLAVAGALRGVFAGVPWIDLPVLLGAALGLGAVAVLACWQPARRAAATDPKEALIHG